MTQESTQDNALLAMALLDIVPGVLRRMHVEVLNNAGGGEPMMAEFRTTPGQLSLLRILVDRQCCMMQELAEQLAVTPPTATVMVKRLLNQGYIERSRDESDWRTVWVKPTAQARQAVEIYDRLRRDWLQERLEQLNEAERAHLIEALPAFQRLIES